MFTGLVQCCGMVTSAEPAPFGRRLVVDAENWSHQPQVGHSIAVNGCCLTVASIDRSLLAFDVVAQTLRVTTLDSLGAGQRVNLEHSATPTTLLGGHIVQGHVDGTGRVIEAGDSKGEYHVRIEPPYALIPQIIPRGSIAVDGISLTLAEVHERSFVVALIPTTLALTTLGERRAGDAVNLETDYIVKIVLRSAEGVYAARRVQAMTEAEG